ncbi:MAG: hypothetical protein ACP5QO_09690 [Clostridia bacterium]
MGAVAVVRADPAPAMNGDRAGAVVLLITGIVLLIIGLAGTGSGWGQTLVKPLGIVFGKPGGLSTDTGASSGLSDTTPPDTTETPPSDLPAGGSAERPPTPSFNGPPEADPFANLPLPDVVVP